MWQNNYSSCLVQGASCSPLTQHNHPIWQIIVQRHPRGAGKMKRTCSHLRASAPRRTAHQRTRQVFVWRNGHADIAGNTMKRIVPITETGEVPDLGRVPIRHHAQDRCRDPGLHRSGALEALKSPLPLPNLLNYTTNNPWFCAAIRKV